MIEFLLATSRNMVNDTARLKFDALLQQMGIHLSPELIRHPEVLRSNLEVLDAFFTDQRNAHFLSQWQNIRTDLKN